MISLIEKKFIDNNQVESNVPEREKGKSISERDRERKLNGHRKLSINFDYLHIESRESKLGDKNQN